MSNETDRIEQLERALADIREEWAGAECGEPIHAQEAYAIGLAKRMYRIAVDALAAAPQPAQPDSDHSAQVVREAPPKPIWTPQWVGSIPAEESDAEFARQIEVMRRGPAQPSPQPDPAALDAWKAEILRLAHLYAGAAAAAMQGGEDEDDARAALEAKLREVATQPAAPAPEGKR